MSDAFTVLAGSVGSRKNIIIGSDVIYSSGPSGGTMLRLMATDEIYINPSAVGSDDALTVNAAMLAQGGSVHAARSCGEDGSVLLPVKSGVPQATLHTNGSFAMRETGSLSASFGTRNYVFDTRFETMQPPFFLLLGASWGSSAGAKGHSRAGLCERASEGLVPPPTLRGCSSPERRCGWRRPTPG